jgi:secreted PhoX family phosphatase
VVPDTGAFNTTVVISGTNFSTTTAQDIVSFNGISATVNSATATQLSVSVPKGAGTGVVKVSVNGQNATGPTFNYVYTYTVSTLAGGTQGFKDGTGAAAQFADPYGIAVDTGGNVIVADDGSSTIRKVTPGGVVTTLTGGPGYLDGPVASSLFLHPLGVTVDAANNIYVADAGNHKIREISAAGQATTIAGTTEGYSDGKIASAQFEFPWNLAVEPNGDIYVICEDPWIRLIHGNTVSTVFDGKKNSPPFVTFVDIINAPNNNLLVTDGGFDIYNLTMSGVLTVVAGNGNYGFADGPALSASFDNPFSMAMDTKGNIYVADFSNFRVRMISTNGTVSTIAGTGTKGIQDGPGATAQFENMYGIAVDKSGNIYVSEDEFSYRIRKITVE